MLHIGCHLSSAKGYLAMGKDAVNIKADTFAFSPANHHSLLKDRKKFVPHVNLVRKGEPTGTMEKMQMNLPVSNMEVSEISLMRSDRGKNGMIYTPIGIIEADK